MSPIMLTILACKLFIIYFFPVQSLLASSFLCTKVPVGLQLPPETLPVLTLFNVRSTDTFLSEISTSFSTASFHLVRGLPVAWSSAVHVVTIFFNVIYVYYKHAYLICALSCLGHLRMYFVFQIRYSTRLGSLKPLYAAAVEALLLAP